MLKGMRGKFAAILFGIIAEVLFLTLYLEALFQIRDGIAISGLNFQSQPISVFVKLCGSAVASVTIPIATWGQIWPKEKKRHRDKIVDPFAPQDGNRAS
jgi:hypothetical protein